MLKVMDDFEYDENLAYDDEELYNYPYDDMYFDDAYTVDYNLITHCIQPTLTDAFQNFLIPILVSNISLKLLSLIVKPILLLNLFTIGTGTLLIFYHLYSQLYLFYTFICYCLICSFAEVLTGNSKKSTWICSLIIVTTNEAMVFLDPNFVKLRAHLMLVVMKIVSFNDFVKAQETTNLLKKFLAILAYALHPSTLLLGVWHPEFDRSANKLTIYHLLNTIKCLVSGLLFLLISTCFVYYYFVNGFLSYLIFFLGQWLPLEICDFIEKSFHVYFTALQFRTSHYFICYMSEAMIAFWNQSLSVVKPSSVEFPRSLVDVVVAWNIPMHMWLKNYVFAPSQRIFGIFWSILVTYFISSFLHGLNFQIWTVLLSLGVLTKVEYDLRAKLSRLFDACIEARRCKYKKEVESNEVEENLSRKERFKRWIQSSRQTCIGKGNRENQYHKNTPYNNFSVALANILFAFLAVSHLAYLGSTFDGKEESSSLKNVMNVWGELNYFSHTVVFATFIFHILI